MPQILLPSVRVDRCNLPQWKPLLVINYRVSKLSRSDGWEKDPMAVAIPHWEDDRNVIPRDLVTK